MENKFIFVCNIKDPLAGPKNPYPEFMEAFLLSEKYSTNTTIASAQKCRASGSLIVSDNGNFSRMKNIAGQFIEKGSVILAEALKDIDSKGKIKIATLRKRKLLMQEIQATVKAQQEKIDLAKITERQLNCSPDYLIGMEDFTIPVLHMCNMLDPVFSPSPISVKRFQKKTQELYFNQKKGMNGRGRELKKIKKFLVYHGYDYKSAKQAFLINNQTEPDGIAISFGATMLSKKFVRTLKLERKTYHFNELVPESYLLSIALMLGSCGDSERKLPIHILGVGTPILIILLALFLNKSRAISIDSTSTFKDADDGTIYGSRYAYLKMDMYKIAATSLLSNDPYHNSSPWFKWFDDQYPSDWNGLYTRLKVKSTEKIQELSARLRSHPRLLEKYIPFFTPMRGGSDDFIKKVRIARAGNNYWVLKSICREVRKRRSNNARLNKWIESEVQRYEQCEFTDPKWANAVRTCFEIINDKLNISSVRGLQQSSHK